ncbi:glycerol-3-phosphate 1-O-acyltransferase PlsY [Spirochaetes bacterium]|uniref:Glycerol-3-phosphate acyltransferase n=1 Tax=Candidatus Scatousia excrementipullorum TaxID=2840936 RepID=A0A9D9DMS5_9BACT|nr:glycerol-3-phosphate 1-O-acyltransferase PlsY [Candidatus Scatousia excrementipullorum]
MEKLIELVIIFITSYLIGSIPTGYIIVKAFTGQDIRKVGSGSTGATNVKRVMGKKWFFTVMILDAIKGALPVVLAAFFASSFKGIGLLPVVAAVAVIIGHSRSIFLNFTGGKSVASGVGTILALNWQVGLMTALIWAIITYASKYVSLGSIIALALSPVLMWWCKAPIAYIAYCALGAVYIIWLHRSNIKRLIKGEENKVRE